MTRTTAASRTAGCTLRNQRGVALLIVLTIVALLTIIVTEFTYSVQIDQHRTRNALHALQAQLLARSGVNLAEGFLMLDAEPKYDAYSEDWWMQLVEFCKGMPLDETMRLRCRVQDESGKVNVNNTRGVIRRVQSQRVTGDAILRDAMRCMFQHRGIDVEIVDKLADYWQQDPVQKSDGTPSTIPDFTSLEDFGAMFGIPTQQLNQLRRVLTAQPSRLLPRINVNTAPAEVLASVLNADKPDCPADDAVEEIIKRQMDPDQPFQSASEVTKMMSGDENANLKAGLFDVRSRLYRLEASALTNVDPTNPTSGGIGQTLSVLVARTQGPARPGTTQATQVGANGQPIPNWTLRPLDWQKEGGARLFRSVPSDQNPSGNPDDEGEPNDMARSSG